MIDRSEAVHLARAFVDGYADNITRAGIMRLAKAVLEMDEFITQMDAFDIEFEEDDDNDR